MDGFCTVAKETVFRHVSLPLKHWPLEKLVYAASLGYVWYCDEDSLGMWKDKLYPEDKPISDLIAKRRSS